MALLERLFKLRKRGNTKKETSSIQKEERDIEVVTGIYWPDHYHKEPGKSLVLGREGYWVGKFHNNIAVEKDCYGGTFFFTDGNEPKSSYFVAAKTRTVK